MDLMSIAAAIYAQLAANLIEKSGKALSQKFKTPEKERAVERCVHSALVALLTNAANLEDPPKKRLKKLLHDFFDDEHTVQELKALLRGTPANREELWAIFQEHAGKEGSVAGFDFERAMDRFEAAFIEAAAEEPELVEIIQVQELRKQSGLQKEMLAELRELVHYLRDVERNTLKLREGQLAAKRISDREISYFAIPRIDLTVKIQMPEHPMPVVDVTPEHREKKQFEDARRRYLERLRKFCNSLPLAALGGDEGTEETVTLEKVYIALDTTERSTPALAAAGKTNRLVLLGVPGSGKSTFVKMLCGWLAATLEDPMIKLPPGFPDVLLPVFVTLRELAPRLALQEFSRLGEKDQQQERVEVFREQLKEELKRLNAESFHPWLDEALLSGKSLLVLDGLDEVPFDLREEIRKTVHALVQHYHPERIIITCRSNSYTADSLPSNFDSYTLAQFSKKKIEGFVTAWYQALRNLGKMDARKVKERIANLKRAATSTELIELAENPMLLTTMTLIHQEETKLPRERVKLYDKAVELLVSRWQKHKAGEDELTLSPALKTFLNDDLRLRQTLEGLAYESHRSGRDKETSDLKRSDAIEILEKAEYLDNLTLAGEFLDYVDQRSGLLIGYGGEPRKPLSYGFPHRTFQEYLAGCYLVSRRDAAREVMKHASKGNYWATAVQLGFEELLYNRRNENTLLDLAYRLCPKIEASSPAEERQHLWSSNIALLLGTERIERDALDPNGGKAYLERLRKALLSLLPGSLPFPERVEAGRNLVALGDDLEGLNMPPPYKLREKAIQLGSNAVEAMLKRLDYFESHFNRGNGCIHLYEPQTRSGGKVVKDYATGLMWQQAGSPGYIVYEEAKKYIEKLNRQRFAGYSDWRLPTLEEAMSLMEPEKENAGLYIDPVFDKTQGWIWTSDQQSASVAWVVNFYIGICDGRDLGSYGHVRAVCYGQSF